MPPELRDFFSFLVANIMESYFADPKHGSDHAMQAWIHIGFPGARANFSEWVDKYDTPCPLGPTSIFRQRA